MAAPGAAIITREGKACSGFTNGAGAVYDGRHGGQGAAVALERAVIAKVRRDGSCHQRVGAVDDDAVDEEQH